jgi:hypothetical protein
MADDKYLQDYLAGMHDLEKLMDKYFRRNLTALVNPNPPEKWIKISARVDSLQYAISDKKAAPSL